ncbi:gamma-glutamylcyclotransferase [Methylobacterium sp. E-065]|uniref:gamma-glutamylcyclotransferase n=1 Tax=Methylobacterium sp. E-065 TaxID=2836583 RepID=UPI001FB9AF8D|nr:gamma-glutamylcyclotransferase [Methylobacterium sp. E-065]MCJ2017500.1 gamma-glutamylcyclotransferase [Methylobacterium sp. E-065]
MPFQNARTLDLSLDLIARAHSVPVPDDPDALAVLSDAELGPGLDAIVDGRAGSAVWVFAYGSLMWNPEFPVAERRIGTVRGFHRRFCLLQRRFRGTPERPGFVLALDRGGLCRGVAFRLPDSEIREALTPVWRREMRGRGYVARWLPVATEEGTVSALTFLANRASDRYAGRLSDPEIAEKIAVACGHKGPSAEYLFRTVEACERLGIRDRHLWSLQALVAARLRAGVPAA